ncbi:energy transducer TonB [Nitratifractor sp.]
MRQTRAFLYASLIYLSIALLAWEVTRRQVASSENFESTAVTLVSPEESFEDAQQEVNSEASEACPEVKEEPTPPEPEPESEPPEPEPTPPAQPESEAPTEPPVEEPPVDVAEPRPPEPSLPEERETTAPEEPVEEPPPPLQPLDPVDPVKALSLKECPHAAPPQPKRVKKRVAKESRKRTKHAKKKHKKASSASRASARSRARRGGSANVNRLLAQIRRRIARNKSYPRVARRRRMEGTVRVSFTVTRSGGVSGILVSGPKIFATSARSAVRRAFPVDPSGYRGALPKRISVTLRYRIH